MRETEPIVIEEMVLQAVKGGVDLDMMVTKYKDRIRITIPFMFGFSMDADKKSLAQVARRLLELSEGG